jgi:hypothetical protein
MQELNIRCGSSTKEEPDMVLSKLLQRGKHQGMKKETASKIGNNTRLGCDNEFERPTEQPPGIERSRKHHKGRIKHNGSAEIISLQSLLIPALLMKARRTNSQLLC